MHLEHSPTHSTILLCKFIIQSNGFIFMHVVITFVFAPLLLSQPPPPFFFFFLLSECLLLLLICKGSLYSLEITVLYAARIVNHFVFIFINLFILIPAAVSLPSSPQAPTPPCKSFSNLLFMAHVFLAAV